MKIPIIKLNPKDFINLVGDKETTGFLYYSENPKIFIKDIRNKEIKKGTIEHELSHIFIYKFKIKSKLNNREFKRVLEDKNFRQYNKQIYNTPFLLKNEYLADFVAYIIFGNKEEKNYIKNKYPINYKIVMRESRKFKFNLIIL